MRTLSQGREAGEEFLIKGRKKKSLHSGGKHRGASVEIVAFTESLQNLFDNDVKPGIRSQPANLKRNRKPSLRRSHVVRKGPSHLRQQLMGENRQHARDAVKKGCDDAPRYTPSSLLSAC